MCGIAGVIFPSSIDESALEKVSDRLRSRGPDAAGIYRQQNMALVHRRLKIIDLSDAANQPFSNAESSIHLVYNGEVYNFSYLREELEKKGHRFRTKSDTEVVLNAYIEWGENCFARFDGMFALGILDRRNGPQLILARDRFGIKPLFYCHQENGFAFASQFNALFPLEFVPKKQNPDAILSYLKFGHIPSPLTYFQGVNQVEPGEILHWTTKGLERRKFWSPKNSGRFSGNGSPLDPSSDQNSEPLAFTSFQEAKDSIWDALKNSVKHQSVADVPVGCFLSGGIDSSLLVAAAKEFGDVKTFSIGFQEDRFDERAYAKLIAQRYETDHHEFLFSSSDILKDFESSFEFMDAPLADPAFIPTLHLSKETKKKVTVVFSGDGGDELFFGYPHQRLMKALYPLQKIPSFLRNPTLCGFESLISCFSFLKSEKLAQARKLLEVLQVNSEAQFLENFLGIFGPLKRTKMLQLIDGAKIQSRVTELLKQLPASSTSIEKIELAFQSTFLMDTALAKTDRASMAYGLESRVPFLDYSLVNLSKKVPIQWKTPHGGKWILRSLLQEKLPGMKGSSLPLRTKQGFQLPIKEWLKKDLADFLRDLERDPGILNRKMVSDIISQHQKGIQNHSHLMWSMVVLKQWQKHYKV